MQHVIYCDRGTSMPPILLVLEKVVSLSAKKVQEGIYAVGQHSFGNFRKHQAYEAGIPTCQ